MPQSFLLGRNKDAVPKEDNDIFWMLICKVKATEWLKTYYSALLSTTKDMFNSTF